MREVLENIKYHIIVVIIYSILAIVFLNEVGKFNSSVKGMAILKILSFHAAEAMILFVGFVIHFSSGAVILFRFYKAKDHIEYFVSALLVLVLSLVIMGIMILDFIYIQNPVLRVIGLSLLIGGGILQSSKSS